MPTPHYGQPRYRAIAGELRGLIETGVFSPGSLLPAESALATELQASRGTIRQAIAVLRQEGLVATEHGRGTCVTAGINAQREQDAQEREVRADRHLAELFGIEVGTVLIERETVLHSSSQVKKVIRTYRLRPAP
ncbi:GntR family transcriptional regulator [Micromonospora sp. NPDC049171]|uniref:GntR family transcriptional regulator n=1 Tax=Micromonospora sp. NPDC049171 TaxID=3155770 RepID=UPI003405283B